MTAGQARGDLDAFAAQVQRIVGAVALAGVLAFVLASAAPDVLAPSDGPTPTAQTVFDAIHAKYQFPGEERQDFSFCVPKKYRETWKPDPTETDAPDAYKYDPNECLDAVLTESLDVYEMASEDEAKSLLSYNAPAPGQGRARRLAVAAVWTVRPRVA